MTQISTTQQPAFTVFHYSGNDRSIVFSDRTVAAWPADFTQVATVRGNSLDDAFRLTNHIDTPWTQNEDVTACVKQPVRSTSVGDVIVDEAGAAHVVASFGFKQFAVR